jgi:hypothetical protein
MADFVVGRFSCYTTLRDVTPCGPHFRARRLTHGEDRSAARAFRELGFIQRH